MSNSRIWGYPHVRNLGHPEIRDLLEDYVLVQEKYDGSQFSFGVLDGELKMRSKGQDIYPESAQKMFLPVIEKVQEIHRTAPTLLPEGYVFRGETLNRPKHNTLAYGRVPEGNFILFDIEQSPHNFLSLSDLFLYASSMGVEIARALYHGPGKQINPFVLQDLLLEESSLGGTQVEGVVIKNYHRFGPDGHPLFGKHVSEVFKEKHSTAWKKSNPGGKDIIQNLIEVYKVEARWRKAVEHLRDKGEITNTPKDIGPLIKEAQKDLLEEEGAVIREVLFAWAWPKVARGSAGGIAEWYKQTLMEAQFASDD